MSTYKVLQDIEAEDKLVGPLSFRQCVYAAIGILCYYLCFLVVTKNVALLLILFLPPALFATMFAIPWQTHQTTEIWVLAKIRFFFKPRRRVWDQSGIRELVTITAPKKLAINYTDGLSRDEVNSRLQALANTIDSRGWAIKNVSAASYAKPQFLTTTPNSDRLVGIETFSKPVADDPSYDVLDEVANPIAQQFDTMINASNQAHRERIQQTMAQAATPVITAPAAPAGQVQPPSKYWFMDPAPINAMPTATVAPGSGISTAAVPTADEQAFAAQLKAQNEAQESVYSHMHNLPVIEPLSAVTAAPVAPAQNPVQTMTPPINPAILNLANNNDLNVATIARQANEQMRDGEGEVVVNLH